MRYLGSILMPHDAPPMLLGNPSQDDKDWLLSIWPQLAAQRQNAGLASPIRSLRIVPLLPDVFVSKDGRSYRYLKSIKNASSSIIRLLLDITGEGEHYHEPLGEGTGTQFAMPIFHDNRTEYVSVNGANLRLHRYFYEKPFEKSPMADIRFCVIRDPVERFVSAYLNRIVRLKGQTAPSLEEFASQFGETHITPHEADGIVIGHADKHFTSQTFYLGNDATYYTHIFTMRDLPDLVALLSDLCGKALKLPRRNISLQFEKPAITPATRAIIEKTYRCDYQAFGTYF